MKYVAFLSFGKDSIAQIIKIKELGLPLDEVVYVDIRYTREISGENPIMAAWIPKAEKIIKEKLGITVKHLSAKYTFKEYFYRKKQKGNHIGEIYGFPFVIGAWCNSRLKLDVINAYINSFRGKVTTYVGIAFDEVPRMIALAARSTSKVKQYSVLFANRITEREAFEICKKYDLVSPIYDTSARGGCWFCVKQSRRQIYDLWKNYPDLFNELKELEKDSRCLFAKDISLAELETKFANGYVPPVRSCETPRTYQMNLFENTSEVAEMDLIKELQKVVHKCGDDVDAIIAISKEMNNYDCRVCPRNMYQDDLSKTVCPAHRGKPCRRDFAVCWRAYFKKKAEAAK